MPLLRSPQMPLLRSPQGPDERLGARLLSGDALAAMDRLLAEGEKFDVIHMDPPFGSDADYERRRSVIAGGERVQLKLPAYGDNDRGDVAAYLELLYPLFCRAHELLTPHGSLYLHIDFRRAPHLRLLLDEIFGGDALLNEIVWAYALGGSSKRRFQRKHDTILLYARTPGKHYFDAPSEAATSSMLAGQPKRATDTWETASREPGTLIERDWPDMLVRKTMSNRDKERTGYGTQKPLSLAARMITASCPVGGSVFDPMCGSGTIGVAATLLGRRAVLNDRGAAALDVTRARLLRTGAALKVDSIDDGTGPSDWGEQAPITVNSGVASISERALAHRTPDNPVLAPLFAAGPRAWTVAWGVGKRRDDGQIDMVRWCDHSDHRDAEPIGERLDATGCDTWWLTDAAAQQWFGRL